MELRKLAFLDTYTLPNNSGIMGAVLVTDADTKPLEFRVTAPVKPTNFQKTLYGDVLLEHILVELIALPILNALNEEIDLIIVRDRLFLGVNNKQGIRVARVFSDEDANSKSTGKREELKSYNGSGSKIYLETSGKFNGEVPAIMEKLNGISEQRNLLEPFDRLMIACEQVHMQKTSD